jgi:hypothetical protein
LFSNLHIRNENVELVPIAFEPHCEYSPKKHSQVGTFAQRFILINILLELLNVKQWYIILWIIPKGFQKKFTCPKMTFFCKSPYNK